MFNILFLLSLLIFAILMCGRTFQLSSRGIEVLVIASGNKKLLERIFEASLLPLLSLWAVTVILFTSGFTRPVFFFQPLFFIANLNWPGLLLCYLALLIFILALISFGEAWRIGIDQNSSMLITTGIYRYSRNPIYVFMNLYLLGTVLICPSAFFILFLIGACAGIHRQVLQEEKFLHQKFKVRYQKYARQTRRYF